MTEEQENTVRQMLAASNAARAEAARRDAARMAEYETTEIVKDGRKYWKMAHKVTGLSYQAMDIEAGMRSGVM